MTEEKPSETVNTNNADEFARQAEEESVGIVTEFWDFLIHNKKWWLTPIIVVLLLVIALVFLGGTAAAPFIYTMF
jgi:hypothetical protein